MSSRAIRKLQKLREQELQQSSDQEDESSDDEPRQAPKPKFNAFDLLNAGGEDDDDEDDKDDTEAEAEDIKEPVTRAEPAPTQPNPPKNASKKKKKKAKKAKAQTPVQSEKESKDTNLDEIDKALKDLNVKAPTGTDISTPQPVSQDDGYPKTTNEVLSIELKYLNATNEMRRLFGNVVLENFDQDAGSGRRRDRNETVDLGQALTGKYSPASRGKSLGGTTLRRNPLMQGKDEWPLAPSGGLGMVTDKSTNPANTLYKIVHNTGYKDVQNQFDLCVESMEPQRLIHHLQYNPYHISTLLQVSDIAKHQGDHAVSADLLERALFNIGRSAHSTFGNRLKEGKARLDFLLFENRELWLAGWRYIANLGMKGTWRTAYEWSKLLLSLNDSDPYCMSLLIDHLALRGREYTQFVDLCTQTRFVHDWADLPNIQCSLVMAYIRLNKPQEIRRQLRHAMTSYPWIFTRLAQELDLQHIPKQIWGVQPPNPTHELLMELYILRAKDLWNTPEAVSLIVEVADTLDSSLKPADAPEITLDIARHVILSDQPTVTTHLPHHFVQGRISSSDPLPPRESEAFESQSNPLGLTAQLRNEAPPWIRNLLEQMENGNMGFPRHQDEEDSEIDNNPPDLTNTENNHSDALARGLAGDQDVLKQWLTTHGLEQLQEFLLQYGVDRGNWGEVMDFTPLSDYLEALQEVQPAAARNEILHGIVEAVIGEFAVTMLEDELEMMHEDLDDDLSE